MKITIKKISDKMPIINSLKNYTSQNYIKFHMPGHQDLSMTKQNTKIQKKIINILRDYQNKLYSYDLTEVENLDNLQKPVGCIKKSEDILSEYFGAKKTFLLTQGSTLGVMAMIMGVLKKGEKIILPKNSHKSVFQAIKLKELKPIFIEQEKNTDFDIEKKIDMAVLEDIVATNSDAKAIFLTSPDYYGNTQDIQKISTLAHKNKMYLMVDSAHGAHFKYMNQPIPVPIELGADAQSLSYHKTLPSLTMSAILQLSDNLDEETILNIKNSINLLQTTSPSYIILSNIELNHYIMDTYGKKLYYSLNSKIKKFKKNIENYKNLSILDNDDPTRIVIKINNLSGKIVNDILRYEYKILAEMYNLKSVVFICNVFNTTNDFNLLENALKYISDLSHESFDIVYEKNYVSKNNFEDFLKKNKGNKSDRNIYIYPPGTLFLAKGEKIDDEKFAYLKSAIVNNLVILQDS